MALPVPLAYSVFSLYFGVIGLCFWHVFRSILSRQKASSLASGRPFLFLRTAFGSLLCTWWFMFKYMHWSYVAYTRRHLEGSVGDWLANTSLFEEAWTIVCTSPANWWWSSFICTWTVIFTAIVWRESARRDIPHAWAYMLLGQLVAMSVASGLFFCACALHPRVHQTASRAPMWLSASLVVALWTVARTPVVVGTTRFLPNLLTMHGSLLLPLLAPASATPATQSSVGRATQLPFTALYALLIGLAGAIHFENHTALLNIIPTHRHLWTRLYTAVFSHPAQSSISLDVVWVVLTLLALFFSSGSFISIILKASWGLSIAALAAVRLAGVPLSLILSLVPLVIIGGIGLVLLALGRVRTENEDKRKKLLDGLGLTEGPIPGTDTEPPRMGGRKTIVGFWHPYCNAGGGGERVLWSAIAYLQREKQDVVSLVYTGDYPEASKEEIINKVQERFSITLSPNTLQFVPLPSRQLISDSFWSHLTLLGQSLGSVYLAFEGLAGKDGLWGDVFIDSMGYAFTLPVVRLIAGPTTAIGTYTHYPTVSADMVKRVRTGAFGVENQGGSRNPLKTQLKLLYYSIFTSLYSSCLLFSRFTMTNSSWTQAHIESLLASARRAWPAQVFLPNEVVQQTQSEVVYPPCDVDGLTKLGNLDKRRKQLVSLAQFRPEKEHYKQIRAMAILLQQHQEYREGENRVTLTLMGGVRHPADQARVDSLRQLASDLGVQDNVEFLVNAPYPEIVRRLGEASVGLNTMQDEHFGINVVEFMAAGLIPIVHASAGPKMDIVTPFHSQETGYHAISPQDFADRIHDVLTLSKSKEKKMREAARGQAKEKFSLEGFERGFEKAWGILVKSLEVTPPEKQQAVKRRPIGGEANGTVAASRGLKQRNKHLR